MYNNQYAIWLFVGISSVLVSQTTSERQTNETCTSDKHCPGHSKCGDQGYCTCDKGYQFVSGYCEFDECSSPHRCHQNALCNNTVWSYYCTCKSGYTANGQTCTDIDECSDSRLCDRSAVCENYPGGYSCTCLTGYSGNGTICTDIEECSKSSPCGKAAVCENYPGGYNCTCLTGYSENGTVCTDIDECSESSPCHKSAFCENYPGGYICTCLTGYSGNGTVCTEARVPGSNGLATSPGAIAGGVFGACAVLVAVVVLVVILTRRRRKEKSDVDGPMSSSQAQYENVRRSSGVSTVGNAAALMPPDVDGARAELHHINSVNDPQKNQVDQTPPVNYENSGNNLAIYAKPDFTYNDHDAGESAYEKLWGVESEQPSANFPEQRSRCNPKST